MLEQESIGLGIESPAFVFLNRYVCPKWPQNEIPFVTLIVSISLMIIIIGLPKRNLSLNNKWENPHEQREQVYIVYPFAYTK